MAKKRGLGRSLEALLTKPSALNDEVALLEGEQDLDPSSPQRERLVFLPLTQLQPGQYQPRRDMDPEALQELADSIRAQGIIQPIVVRKVNSSIPYEIIAGERRWRAAQVAGLTEIPAIVRDLPDEAVIAMALIENIQRESLNPIEEADALQQLIHQFEMTHQQVAEALGKSRTNITNTLRLLALTEDVKGLLSTRELEMGHARALLGLPQEKQLPTARNIINQKLSVRQAEHLVRMMLNPPTGGAGRKPIDPDLKRLQTNLSSRIGLKVNIDTKASGKGKVVIHYNNLNELDNLLDLIPG